MNKFQYKVQGVDYDVEIEELEGNVAKVNVNGIKFEVVLIKAMKPGRLGVGGGGLVGWFRWP